MQPPPPPTPSPTPVASPSPIPSPTEPPTAVDLMEFKAEATDDGIVILKWKTASEADNAGFNIYRSKRNDDTYKKVNGKLVPAEGNGAFGASYRFEDTPGSGTFYYKLEDVDVNGLSAMHGTKPLLPPILRIMPFATSLLITIDRFYGRV